MYSKLEITGTLERRHSQQAAELGGRQRYCQLPILVRPCSRKMYEWMLDDTQRRQAITAIYIYVYTMREGGDMDEPASYAMRIFRY